MSSQARNNRIRSSQPGVQASWASRAGRAMAAGKAAGVAGKATQPVLWLPRRQSPDQPAAPDDAGDGGPGGDCAADARLCAAVVRAHARTFSLASYFLPPAKRRAAFALYAFCRVADDMVDGADPDDTAATELRLAEYAADLERALEGRPRGPVFRELARFVTAYRVPPSVLRGLLAGVARDVAPVSYRSWSELGNYCEGVASTVGEMCTHVFGVAGGAHTRERALDYARTLGVAMQLTNILRDVGEDARRGRCYLPEEELVAVGLSPAEVLDAGRRGNSTLARDPRWRALIGFQIARARALYAAASPGIALLSADSRRCASACANGYAAILDAIEARDYDSISGRARVSRLGRAAVLWESWRSTCSARNPDAANDGPAVSWTHAGPSPLALTALASLSRTVS